MNKFKLQENQYFFPYHHIPFLDKERGSSVIKYRVLSWAHKYFCCLLHLKKKIEEYNPNSVLDIGCGDGRLLGLLNKSISKKTGVDLSKRAIDFARGFHPEIEFLAVDADQLKEKFDIVVAMEVLEHISDEDISDFFKKMENRINEYGHIIISVPTKVIPLNKKHYRHYDLELFQKQLKNSRANLKVIDVEYIFKSSSLINFYNKLTCNSFWIIDFKFFNRLLWQYIWRNRVVSDKLGEELVLVLRKKKSLDV